MSNINLTFSSIFAFKKDASLPVPKKEDVEDDQVVEEAGESPDGNLSLFYEERKVNEEYMHEVMDNEVTESKYANEPKEGAKGPGESSPSSMSELGTPSNGRVRN